jgi:hypothetical protein
MDCDDYMDYGNDDHCHDMMRMLMVMMMNFTILFLLDVVQ